MSVSTRVKIVYILTQHRVIISDNAGWIRGDLTDVQ